MIRFRTRSAIAMRAMVDALVAGGNPTQYEGRKRKVAITSADSETLTRVRKEQRVNIIVEPSAPQHRTNGGVSVVVSKKNGGQP